MASPAIEVHLNPSVLRRTSPEERFETRLVSQRLELVEGTIPEWEENGWGWVEQMEEINLPSLEAALNPSR